MSRFYGILQGNRGEATRQGTPNSGIKARAQGWNIGAAIIVDDHEGTDRVDVYLTGGSNHPGKVLLELGTYKLVDGKPVKIA